MNTDIRATRFYLALQALALLAVIGLVAAMAGADSLMLAAMAAAVPVAAATIVLFTRC